MSKPSNIPGIKLQNLGPKIAMSGSDMHIRTFRPGYHVNPSK